MFYFASRVFLGCFLFWTASPVEYNDFRLGDFLDPPAPLWSLHRCLLPYFEGVKSVFEFLLKNFDPALLQNVVLGILAIFIPIAVAIFTDMMEPSKSSLEKIVLKDQVSDVLRVKEFFLASVLTLILLAFTPKDVASAYGKAIVVIFGFCYLYFCWWLLSRALKFVNTDRNELYIQFLEGFTKRPFWKDKSNGVEIQDVKRFWDEFWLASSVNSYDERFVRIFLSHIDYLLRRGWFAQAITISNTYLERIDQCAHFRIGLDILPRVLEWHEFLWYEQYARDRSLASPSGISASNDGFFQWDYFGQDFFSEIIRLAKSDHTNITVVQALAKHVTEGEKKVSDTTEDRRDVFYEYYVSGLIRTFFNGITRSDHVWTQSERGLWKSFPNTWKITSSNASREMSRVVAKVFAEWGAGNVLKQDSRDGFGRMKANFVRGLFPRVDACLFPVFLGLYFSGGSIHEALRRDLSFILSDVELTVRRLQDESEEAMMARLYKITQEQRGERKREAISVAAIFFPEYGNRMFLEEKKRMIECQDMIDFCKNSVDPHDLERRRQDLSDLINGLIEYVSNRSKDGLT